MPSHRVQCTPVLEPRELALVEGMIQFRVPGRTIFRMYSQGQGLTDRQLGTHDIYLVIWIDFVVVRRVIESQWQQALFLKVGFVLCIEQELAYY